ncbi:MAG: hypothetical protein N3D10_02985 [Candidatus Micrarchaeota archaeon]|nr:hypothetical protein [Candidatus Micrarchaeota archaeon]
MAFKFKLKDFQNFAKNFNQKFKTSFARKNPIPEDFFVYASNPTKSRAEVEKEMNQKLTELSNYLSKEKVKSNFSFYSNLKKITEVFSYADTIEYRDLKEKFVEQIANLSFPFSEKLFSKLSNKNFENSFLQTLTFVYSSKKDLQTRNKNIIFFNFLFHSYYIYSTYPNFKSADLAKQSYETLTKYFFDYLYNSLDAFSSLSELPINPSKISNKLYDFYSLVLNYNQLLLKTAKYQLDNNSFYFAKKTIEFASEIQRSFNLFLKKEQESEPNYKLLLLINSMDPTKLTELKTKATNLGKELNLLSNSLEKKENYLKEEVKSSVKKPKPRLTESFLYSLYSVFYGFKKLFSPIVGIAVAFDIIGIWQFPTTLFLWSLGTLVANEALIKFVGNVKKGLSFVLNTVGSTLTIGSLLGFSKIAFQETFKDFFLGIAKILEPIFLPATDILLWIYDLNFSIPVLFASFVAGFALWLTGTHISTKAKDSLFAKSKH